MAISFLGGFLIISTVILLLLILSIINNLRDIDRLKTKEYIVTSLVNT